MMPAPFSFGAGRSNNGTGGTHGAAVVVAGTAAVVVVAGAAVGFGIPTTTHGAKSRKRDHLVARDVDERFQQRQMMMRMWVDLALKAGWKGGRGERVHSIVPHSQRHSGSEEGIMPGKWRRKRRKRKRKMAQMASEKKIGWRKGLSQFLRFVKDAYHDFDIERGLCEVFPV